MMRLGRLGFAAFIMAFMSFLAPAGRTSAFILVACITSFIVQMTRDIAQWLPEMRALRLQRQAYIRRAN
jgi:hypothetical protein